MGMDAEYFNQAEGITIYTSRSLSYSHMKPNNKLIKESINDKGIKVNKISEVNPINPRKQDATEDFTK
ncbi:unnamed protein product [Rhizophagus irregularis]|nr:unnamed protein product [Rhizophagus irregularis]